MAAAELLCPQCGTPYEEGDFLCTGCELILDLDAAEANYKPNQPSIVRALLSPPQRRTGVRPAIPAELKKKGDPDVTVRANIVMDDFTIPRLVVGMNMALTPLHEFEAMVASFVDGTSSVPMIAAAAEISRVEAMAVFSSLVERKVIELRREQAQAPAPAPELDDELPTPPPTPPPAPALDPDPPPAPARTPLPTDLPVRKPIVAQRPAPMLTPSRTPVVMPPPRADPVPTPAPGRLKASSLQAPSPVATAPKAESVLERAISLERRGEVDGAIHILKRAITQVKEPAALCNKLALILVNQRKDYRQAEELLNKAIELEPENDVYQQNLFKIVSLSAERKDSRGSGSSSSSSSGKGGFFSKLLKK